MGWIPKKRLPRRYLWKGSRFCVVTSDTSCVFKVVEYSEKRVIVSPPAGHPLAEKYPTLILKKKDLAEGGFATLYGCKPGGGKVLLRNILSLSLLPAIMSSTISTSF